MNHITLISFSCEYCPHTRHSNQCECRQGEECYYVCTASKQAFTVKRYNLGKIPDRCPCLNEPIQLHPQVICSNCGKYEVTQASYTSERLCRICTVKQEIEKAKVQANRIQGLEEELKKLESENNGEL